MTAARLNRDLLLPYFLPYLAYTGVATLAAGQLSREWDYGLRIVATSLALAWGWRSYVSLRGPGSAAVSIATGILAGLVGLGLWIALLTPFVEPHTEAWPARAIGLRILAACTLVPLFEELGMRGFVHRIVLQWQRNRAAKVTNPSAQTLDRGSIENVEPGDWSVTAVLASAALFAAAHNPSEYPAALAYGILMSSLWILRKDLLSCVVAHAVTNLALAGYVIRTGQWQLW